MSLKREDYPHAAFALCTILMLLVLLSGAAFAARFGPYEAELLRVVDGDTYDMRVQIWPHPLYDPPVRVRLINADTPELESQLACERLLAARATERASAMLNSATRIEISDVKADSLGGRFLARVLVDGEDMGELLKAGGHARPWRRNDKTPWCVETKQ